MNTPLLTTKLRLPILRQDLVRRARLLEYLSTGLWQADGFVRKLTLISAPAGFGKTTLVSAWLSDLNFMLGGSAGADSSNPNHLAPTSHKNRVAWLSLDESDNDPVLFLEYLIAALRQLQPDFGATAEALLQLPQPPPSPVILTALINEISGLSAPWILALDDYHTIHTAAIHQHLAFILEHQPANLHLVLLTREDPLLPVARLRARGQLLEMRQDDLRFSQEEIGEFLRRSTGLMLKPEDLNALLRRTEGWVAGLQLAALSMRGCADLSVFIHDFTGSDRYILDYLIEEVFSQQPAPVQDFLLRTALLKRLSGPLCDAVTGRCDSTEVLSSLEQSNLFIVPLDAAHTWYRYHRLFAELLQHRSRLADIPESSLHQRASQWYEAQDFRQEAVDHSLLAHDWGSACRLIGAMSTDLFKRGEAATLLGWCSRLPRQVVCADLNMCLVYIWAALIAGQYDLAAGLLETAEYLAPPGSSDLGQVAAAQAFLARALRDNPRAIDASEQALALLPAADFMTRGNIAMNLGLAYWHEGRMGQAEASLMQAIDLCAKTGNGYALLTSQIFLARIPAVQGKLRKAAALLEKLLEADRPVIILCLAYYDLAAIHLEWNDLPQAQDYFAQGFALAQRSGSPEFQQAGLLLQANLAWANGDEALAWAALEEADALMADFPPVVRSRTTALGVQLALAYDNPVKLARWTAQLEDGVEAHSFYRFIGLAQARLLLAQGKTDEAANLLLAHYEKAAAAGWGYGALVMRLLQCQAASDNAAGLFFITEALRFGQSEGFLRSFVEAGRGIIPLVQEAARRGVEPAYAGRILAAFGAQQHLETLEQAGLVEPLSERELEVLRLVTAGLSNREIAAQLVISPGTAKTHIHNLCGKLGVRNRTEAAMRAKELRLV